VYMVDLDDPSHENLCLAANKHDLEWLWHRRLGHASYRVLHKLFKFNMVRGVPEISFNKLNKICHACIQGKQTKSSFKSRTENLSSKPVKFIHMDLFGPTRTTSLSGKRYGYVLVDDYSRFTWVFFLSHKNEAFHEFQVFYRKIKQEGKYKVCSILSNHGVEFDNYEFGDLCSEEGINHRFTSPRTLEQNGVVER